MSNHHLRNTELSLKAKGLLSLMLSLPENWDYTTKGLSMICKDGIDSINSGLKELEANGYVIRRRLRNEKGQLTTTEYTIFEQPQSPDMTDTPPKGENPILDNPILGNPTQEKPILKKPKQAEPILGNPHQLSTNILNTNSLNMEVSNPYPSNPHQSSKIGYIYFEAPEHEQNFSTLIEFINVSEVREDDEDFKNPVDLMFDALEEKDPGHFAVRQYKKYKLAAGKTAKSILISCGARLSPFDIRELREITAYDEMELDTLKDRKTALFIIISYTDDTFNFLVSMAYTQLFNLLCDKADDVYGGRLPIHVRCLIDEAANIGQIPKLEKLMATIRSRELR